MKQPALKPITGTRTKWHAEWTLVPVWLLVIIIELLGKTMWLEPIHHLTMASTFLALFFTILLAAFRAVHHAEKLASRLGEPIGSVLLTLAVVTIEVSIIAAVMMAGEQQPTMARDTMYAVVMITMNGLIGTSLLLGGLLHKEQTYNLQGANTYLAVIIPLSVIALVLPNYTLATPEASYSLVQSVIIAAATMGLYFVFLGVQTTRHQAFFEDPYPDKTPEPVMQAANSWRPVVVHSLLLLAYLIPVVILSETIAIPIEHGISELQLPVALGGLLIAILILSPEALSAIQAARANKIQRSINILLGSATATIGLTVAAVLLIGVMLGTPVILGLETEDVLLLILTLAVSMVSFSSGRTNILLGAVHLVLFITYLMLMFDNF